MNSADNNGPELVERVEPERTADAVLVGCAPMDSRATTSRSSPSRRARWPTRRAGVDPTRRVPSCPEWDVAKLVRHTGTAHRWCDRGRAVRGSRSRRRRSTSSSPTTERAAGLARVERGARSSRRCAAEDPDATCWTWTDDRTVGFWSRRMAHETVGAPVGRPGRGRRARRRSTATLAVDGIDEHLENLPFILGAEHIARTGETLHLHCTDVTGEWLLRSAPDGLE